MHACNTREARPSRLRKEHRMGRECRGQKQVDDTRQDDPASPTTRNGKNASFFHDDSVRLRQRSRCVRTICSSIFRGPPPTALSPSHLFVAAHTAHVDALVTAGAARRSRPVLATALFVLFDETDETDEMAPTIRPSIHPSKPQAGRYGAYLLPLMFMLEKQPCLDKSMQGCLRSNRGKTDE